MKESRKKADNNFEKLARLFSLEDALLNLIFLPVKRRGANRRAFPEVRLKNQA
jgi:hypothetical protein